MSGSDHPDNAAASAGRGPGARLRREREQRLLDLQQVADALHVDLRLVEAMEADRFSAFDAPVYARGFLRKYATYLELSAVELLAAYAALEQGPTTPTLIPVTAGRAMPRDWSRIGMAAALLGATFVVGGSYWWWMARPRAASAAATEPTSALATLQPQTLAADAGEPAAVPNAGARVTSVQPARAAAPLQRHEPRGSAAAGAGQEDELVIRGTGESWVEVYAPTGARLYFDLVRDGDAHHFPGPGPWRVFLGYADGVRLSVGDRAVVIPRARKTAATARIVVAGDGAVQ